MGHPRPRTLPALGSHEGRLGLCCQRYPKSGGNTITTMAAHTANTGR